MISRHIVRGSLAGLLLAGAVFEAGSAAADTPCTQSSDCSKGFTCQVIGATACPTYACPADIDGQACQPLQCTPQMIMGCEPGPCSTDSDCAAGMVCNADSYDNCPAPAPSPSCPPNADCASPAPAVDAGACTTTVVKTCVPRYDLPCTVNSDCGDGFTCVPDTETTCSGSGSAASGGAPSGGGTVSSPPTTTSPPAALDASTDPPACTTTTLPTSSCQVNTIPCTTDGNCPSTWTCVAQSQAVSNVCVAPAQTGAADAAPPECSSGGGSSPPAQMLCEPPDYNGPGVGFANGSPTGGAAPVAAAAGPTNGSDGGTSAGSSGGSGATSAPPGATGGCAVGSPGTGSGGTSLLQVLGLGALGLNRRRERQE